jgi:hypothetical protein
LQRLPRLLHNPDLLPSLVPDGTMSSCGKP